MIDTGVESNFEQEIVLNSYTTSTFWFNMTSTIGSVVPQSDGSWNIENYDNGTSTAFIINPIVFIDSLGNRMTASSSIEASAEGLMYKIQVDDTWLQNAYYPVKIDPTYLISNSRVDANNQLNNVGSRRITRDSNGNLYTVYTSDTCCTTYYIKLASSTDNGLNWTSRTVTSSSAYTLVYPTIAIDSSNNLYVAYRGYRSISTLSKIWLNKISSGTINSPVEVDAYSNDSGIISLLLDSNNIYLSYHYNESSNRKPMLATSSISSISFSTSSIPAGTGYYSDNGNRLLIDGSSNLYNFGIITTSSVRRLIYQKFNGSSWTNETIVNSGQITYQFSCSTLLNNNIVCYGFDSTNGLYKTTYNGSSWSATSSVLTDNSAYSYGREINSSIDQSNNLYISYTNQGISTSTVTLVKDIGGVITTSTVTSTVGTTGGLINSMSQEYAYYPTGSTIIPYAGTLYSYYWNTTTDALYYGYSDDLSWTAPSTYSRNSTTTINNGRIQINNGRLNIK